jgi:hypothetical protein
MEGGRGARLHNHAPVLDVLPARAMLLAQVHLALRPMHRCTLHPPNAGVSRLKTLGVLHHQHSSMYVSPDDKFQHSSMYVSPDDKSGEAVYHTASPVTAPAALLSTLPAATLLQHTRTLPLSHSKPPLRLGMLPRPHG